MRATRLVAAGAAIVLAAALVLVAVDVVRWRSTMRADDLAFRAGASPSWRAGELLPFSHRLLAVDDDRQLRQGMVLFRRAPSARAAVEPGFARRARSDAEVALALAAEESAGAQASQAQDLLGVLAFSDSTSGGAGGRASPVERSIAAFETAIRLDRNNDSAKHNLELVLRLVRARSHRSSTGPSPGTRGTGQRGAGGGTPGRGY
ncbi:MAG: hypothetical protein ABI948_03100 [Thermoleophilia bacterium]